MNFRQSYEELFDDSPEEYIRGFIEGSDMDTRRRAVCDLVNTLSYSYAACSIEKILIMRDSKTHY